MTEQQLYTLLEMPSEAVEVLNEAEGKLNLKEPRGTDCGAD